MATHTKHIIIQVTNNGIYHSKENLVSWEHTNFPAKEHFGLNERVAIFWEVEMINYNQNSEELEIKVIDYQSKKKDALLDQNPKYPISRLKFQKLNGFELKHHLSFFKWNEFDGLIDETQKPIIKSPPQTVPHRLVSEIPSKDYFEVEPINKVFYVNFEVPLKKTMFKDGYVEIIKKLPQSRSVITINIANKYIHSEFDNIKPFFSKALSTRKIRIKGKVHLQDGELIEADCTSDEIDRIDSSLIEAIRDLKMKDLLQQLSENEEEKNLYTSEELFAELGEILGTGIKDDEEKLVSKILDLKKIRNKQQLLYLSGKLHSNKNKLRFTIKPQFGFLFQVHGNQHDHFIWELPNTNATYIWSVDKSSLSNLKMYELVEKELNYIKINGRAWYIKNTNLSDAISFQRIIHSAIKDVDTFKNWKVKLEDMIR